MTVVPTNARSGAKKTPAKKAPGKAPIKKATKAKKPTRAPVKTTSSADTKAGSRKRAAASPGPSPTAKGPASDQQARPEIEAAPIEMSRAWPNAPVRRGIGVALLGLAGAGRFTAGSAPVVGPGAELPGEPVMDVALGAVDMALEVGEKFAAGARQYVNPLLGRAWASASASAPMSGTAGAGLRTLAALTEPLAVRGRRLRADSEHEAAAAVASVLPETIQLVMEQLDLTELAIDHVDIQRVLEATAEQVDLTGFALEHIDLVRIIEASLDEVDFTGMAISRLDFARAVTAAMEQVDVLMVAREQMDPARVAQYLRDNVDVAEALRAAPNAVAGEAVRGMRQTVGRITGRR